MAAPSEQTNAHRSRPIQAAWRRGIDGKGVSVGHLDTGLVASHPAFRSVSVTTRAIDHRGRLTDDEVVSDPDGHGTATASLICGGETNGVSTGVAPGVRLLSAQVLEQGDVLARALVGLEWVVRSGAQIVCMPLGMREASPVFARAMRQLRDAGVVVVVASGNGGAGTVRSPADSEDVIAVGACDRGGRVSSTSGSQSAYGGVCIRPDVLAPGVDVFAASATGTTFVSGTSYAAAHVAGVAALLRQAAPDATPDQIRAALVASAWPVAPEQAHRSRAGQIDPVGALETLMSGGRSVNGATVPGQTRNAAEIKRFVDPLLLDQLDACRAGTVISAIVVAASIGEVAAKRLLANAEARSRCGALEIAYLPAGDTTIIRAPADFVRALIASDDASVISSVRVPRTF